jgi:hypothetical protein
MSRHWRKVTVALCMLAGVMLAHAMDGFFWKWLHAPWYATIYVAVVLTLGGGIIYVGVRLLEYGIRSLHR